MKKLIMLILMVVISFSVFATEYQIIKGHDSESLESSVNDYLKWGWTCQGGVQIYSDGYFNYFQAMIKE